MHELAAQTRPSLYRSNHYTGEGVPPDKINLTRSVESPLRERPNAAIDDVRRIYLLTFDPAEGAV